MSLFERKTKESLLRECACQDQKEAGSYSTYAPYTQRKPKAKKKRKKVREAWSPAARAAAAAARRVKKRGGDWRTAATKVFINKGGASKLPFGWWQGSKEGRGNLVTAVKGGRQRQYSPKKGKVLTYSNKRVGASGSRAFRRSDRIRMRAYRSALSD